MVLNGSIGVEAWIYKQAVVVEAFRHLLCAVLGCIYKE